jgi:nitrite reductase/ring-hydroxylating ferredoxin subunit
MTIATSQSHSASSVDQYVRVGALDEIANPTVVSGGRHGIAVFISDGQPFAVDNRCPHMGFPLHRGSVRDGILTCHWHHARFDLASGGTFDPWADDVRVYPTIVDGGVVFVDPNPPHQDWEARWKSRLRDGMEQNLNLLVVKSVLALLDGDVPPAEIVDVAARFGGRYRESGWQSGMTILAAMTNQLPFLRPEDRVLALYHGVTRVARDCAGEPPRFQLDALPTASVDHSRLVAWFRSFCEVRDRDGAERALLTAIEAGMPAPDLASMLFCAVTDHFFLDGGHSLDFINKACEMLDTVGWDQAAEILPSVVPSITGATRSEELNNWRHPVDLVSLIADACADLPASFAFGADDGHILSDLVEVLLGDEPAAIMSTLRDALRSGVSPRVITRTLSYAAALRVARFHTSNEFSDWITVLHTFTYANALHQAMRRAPSVELARGIFHGAARIYLDRFLNMPAARLPENRNVEHEPTDADTILRRLLDLNDQEQRVNESALAVHRYLSLGHDPDELIATLGHILLREDGEFHSYQMLEAGTALFGDLREVDPPAAHRVLVAVARYLAAHAPTSRSMYQTARTAIRLHRGDAIYQASPSDDDTDDPVAAG